MPAASKTASATTALDDTALQLVEAAQRESTPAAFAALDDFRQRSVAHAQAVRRAERFSELTRSIRPAPASKRQSLALYADVWWNRLLERRMGFAFAAVAIASIGMTFTLVNRTATSPDERQTIQAHAPEPAVAYQTRRREQKEVTLSDGTIVWLGWQTDIEARLAGSERQVDVHRGVAAFKVTSDPTRPFVVRAGDVRTEVTGTEFVVSRPQATRVEVAVLEGSVRVSANVGSVATLSAENVIVAENGSLSEIRHRALEEIGRWRDGMLVFNERPLVDALLELEPYTSYRLDTSYLDATGGRVSGVFFTDQANDALAMILQTHRLEPIERGGNTLMLRPRPPQRP